VRTGVLSLGQALALARKEAGLSQRDLADEIGLSYRSIQEYESDKISALPHLRAIEEATGKPEGWILDHVDPYSRIVSMAGQIEQIQSDIRDILALLRQRP
jgi:transcriptional regulator with XRE-family HTH domain